MQYARSDIQVRYASRQGFTIVELLIVVVVIAILAAITIVAYNGIAKNANNASIQETLSQAARKLEIYKINDPTNLYPSTLAIGGLNLTSSGSQIYVYALSTDSTQYCLASSNSGRTYYVTSTSSTPKPGICNATTGTPGTGDVATDGASSAGATTYSIFNTLAPQTTQTLYTDGGGSLTVGNRFYTTLTNGISVKGLRIYNPPGSDSTFLNLSVTAYGYLNDWLGAYLDRSDTMGACCSLMATKTYSGTRVVGTWTDIVFNTPFTLSKITTAASGNDLLTLMVQFSGGNDYVVASPTLTSGATIQSTTTPGVYLSEDNNIGRGINTVVLAPVTTFYGIDVLFSPL